MAGRFGDRLLDRGWLIGVGLGLAVALPHPAIAQTPSEIPADLEDVEPLLPLPDRPASPPIEPPVEPPAPTLQLPRSEPAPPRPPAPLRVPLQQVEVLGSTVLQAEIAALVEPLRGQPVSFEDLIELRTAITQLYVRSGYVTSGAFLPNNQDLSDGVVQIRVVEGALERVEIGGLQRLRESYVRDRLTLAASVPLNQQALVEALQLLQLNPLIRQVNAELTAGSAPGQNVLLVRVQEANPLSLEVGADNYRSPSLGSEQLSISAAHNNLLGRGDRLSVGYSVTAGLDRFEAGYAVPLNAREGVLSIGYSRDAGQIVEAEFADLEIRSDSETYSIGFRQPLLRSPETEFALSLGLDLRRGQTFILDDEPFSFSEGANNGETNLTVLRLAQEWVDRDARRVLAARSQFSFGLDAFDATVNEIGTDARFFAWLGQFQYVQQLSPRFLLVTRLAAQLTPDSLLSLERFGVGGVDTVRGYRQNQLVTDNGILAAVEGRFALIPDSDRLQLLPFAEFGYGWNNRTPDPSPDALTSVGVGLRWLVFPDLALQLDYGLPLTEVNSGDSLQDSGFYFSLRYQPF